MNKLTKLLILRITDGFSGTAAEPCTKRHWQVSCTHSRTHRSSAASHPPDVSRGSSRKPYQRWLGLVQPLIDELLQPFPPEITDNSRTDALGTDAFP